MELGTDNSNSGGRRAVRLPGPTVSHFSHVVNIVLRKLYYLKPVMAIVLFNLLGAAHHLGGQHALTILVFCTCLGFNM